MTKTMSEMTRAHSMALLHLLHRAGQCADELFAKHMGNSDLTPRQFTVLLAAANLTSPSQTSLVEQTGIDRSTIADIVRRLVDRDLIERRRTRHDARMYVISVTPAGTNALRLAAPAAEKTDATLTAMLTQEQRATLSTALRLIVETLGPISSAGGSGRSGTGSSSGSANDDAMASAVQAAV
jgi:DNA-binding MarR family transcriptional regulator